MKDGPEEGSQDEPKDGSKDGAWVQGCVSTKKRSEYRSKGKGWAKGQRSSLMRGPEMEDGFKGRSEDGSKGDGWDRGQRTGQRMGLRVKSTHPGQLLPPEIHWTPLSRVNTHPERAALLFPN